MQTLQEHTDNTGRQYTIQQFTQADIPALEALHTAVYGKPKPAGYYAKKYDTSFTGKPPLGYIVYDNRQTAVAYYGVLPCLLQAGDRLVLAAQSADSMTHPQLQAKGLFTELSKKTFDLCKSEGVFFIFGFPNQNSYSPAIKKLGWKEAEVMDVFTIQVKPWLLPMLCRRFFKTAYNAYKKFVLKKYITGETGILNSVIKDGFTGIYRDENYLGYKTYSDTFVVPAGRSTAWISIGASVYIGDIDVVDGNLDEVIHTIRNIAKKLGISTIYSQASKGTSLHTAFSHHYNARAAFPVFVQDFESGLDLERLKFTFADIDIF